MNRKILVTFVALMVLAMLATPFVGAVLARPFYKDISIKKTYSMIFVEDHPELLVIDIRPSSMYESGHIAGVINVPLPLSNLDSWIAGAGQSYRNNKIIVHCYLGSMSPIAADLLIDAGFKKVYNMEGGFNAWVGAGYPVVT